MFGDWGSCGCCAWAPGVTASASAATASALDLFIEDSSFAACELLPTAASTEQPLENGRHTLYHLGPNF
jgi:hypothetical protein